MYTLIYSPHQLHPDFLLFSLVHFFFISKFAWWMFGSFIHIYLFDCLNHCVDGFFFLNVSMGATTNGMGPKKCSCVTILSLWAHHNLLVCRHSHPSKPMGLQRTSNPTPNLSCPDAIQIKIFSLPACLQESALDYVHAWCLLLVVGQTSEFVLPIYKTHGEIALHILAYCCDSTPHRTSSSHGLWLIYRKESLGSSSRLL